MPAPAGNVFCLFLKEQEKENTPLESASQFQNARILFWPQELPVCQEYHGLSNFFTVQNTVRPTVGLFVAQMFAFQKGNKKVGQT